MRILGGEPVGVFVHVSGADEDGSRLAQRGYGERVTGRRRVVGVNLRPGHGRRARDVEEILRRERHAGQRSGIPSGGDAGVDRGGFGQRGVAPHEREAVERAVAKLDPVQRRSHDVSGCESSRPDSGDDGVSIHLDRHGLNTGAG